MHNNVTGTGVDSKVRRWQGDINIDVVNGGAQRVVVNTTLRSVRIWLWEDYGRGGDVNADHGGNQGPFCEHHAQLLTQIAYHIGDMRDVKVFRPSFRCVPFWASMCSLEIECPSILIKTPSTWTWQLRPQNLHLRQTIPYCFYRLMVKLHLHPIEKDV